MLIKVGDIYLDMMPGQSIEVDKKVKLFEEIATADGDFSYSFELPPTSKNISTLGLQDINISGKALYNEIRCDLQNYSGITLYNGVLKIERFDENIVCSFFSGNYEWISLIQGSLKDLDLSEYDTDNTLADVELTWDNTSGVIFPLFDKGRLEERIAPSLVFDERIGPDLFLNNDFHPWLFVKSIFQNVFTSSGLKTNGSLFNDFIYNNLIITNNAGNAQEILEARTAFVGKTSTQSIASGSFVKLTWIDNVDPYYDGDENNFDEANDKYIADIDMIVNVTFMLDFDIPSSTQQYDVELRKNGTAIFTVTSYWTEHVSGAGVHEIVAGDELELYVKPFTSTAVCQVGSFFKIETTKVKKVFAVNIVPDLSQIDLIKNIFKLLNVVPTYNPYSKTVTLELFKNIRHKEPQDISKYLSGKPKIDYYEFINEYGRKNKFLYAESVSDEIEEYNHTSVNPYGSGNIELDNVYLQDEQTIVELDFVPPLQYLNEPFQMSLVKLDYLDDEETEEDVIDSVSDSSGVARFNFSGVPPFSTDAGDIVRIKTTSTGVYLGTGIVSASAIGWFELAGVQFNGTCTGTFVKINYTEVSNTDPVIALCLTNTSISSISSLWSSVYINESDTQSSPIAYAYFFRHYQGGIGADGLKIGLSFGDIIGNGFYQQNLIDTYYSDNQKILTDPVKVIGNFLFPESVFLNLDFLYPIRLNSIIGSGLFLLNKISGYKASYLPCEVELIKISAHSQSLTYTEGPAPTPEPEYDEDLQDVLDFAEQEDYTLPSDEVIELLDDLITELKNLGVWEDLDLLYIFSTDGDEDFATLNLVNPATFKASLVNSPTWIPGTGFQGNGTNSYLNTGWDPETNAVHFTQTEGCAFSLVANEIAGSDSKDAFGTLGNGVGPNGNGRIQLRPKTAAEVHLWAVHSATKTTGSSVTSEGFYQVQRRSNTDQRLFKDGSQVGSTDTTTALPLSSRDISILGLNNNGTVQNLSDYQIGVFGIGASFAGKESELNDIFNTFTEAVALLPAGAFLLEDDSGFITLENDTDLLIKEN